MVIDLSGYSHVFISGPSGSTKGGEQNPIAKVECCYQEVFSREQVRSLVLAFHAKQSVSQIREQMGADRPWEKSDPRPLAERAVFVKAVETSDEPAEKEPEVALLPAQIIEESRGQQKFLVSEAPES